MQWRTRRKALIGITTTIVVLFVISIPVYVIFFTGVPTCFDGKMNGDERNIDCGGKCSIVCDADVLPVIVKSSEVFKVTNGIYNGIALIENKNIDSGAFDVPYSFKVIDDVGRVIDERKGVIDIPANSSTAIFAGSLRIKNENVKFTTDVKVSYSDALWTKDGPKNPNVNVTVGAIQNEDSRPRIDGNIINNGEQKSPKVNIVAVISDDDGYPIGVSSTIVDPLSKNASKPIYFSWPEPFLVGSKMCMPGSGRKVSSFLGDVAIVIDRSGSMEYESKNPPEPLLTVKVSAIKFAQSMSGTDKGALVTFADEAVVDMDLSSDYESLISTIDNVAIGTKGIQNTNFGDGIKKAVEVLTGNNSTNKRKAIVILTDGIATRPLSNTIKNYPEVFAKEQTDIAKGKDIEIYVIGLGKNVNESFLKSVASSEQNYYGADRKEELSGIYDSIATSICSKRPAIVKTYVVEMN